MVTSIFQAVKYYAPRVASFFFILLLLYNFCPRNRNTKCIAYVRFEINTLFAFNNQHKVSRKVAHFATLCKKFVMEKVRLSSIQILYLKEGLDTPCQNNLKTPSAYSILHASQVSMTFH